MSGDGNRAPKGASNQDEIEAVRAMQQAACNALPDAAIAKGWGDKTWTTDEMQEDFTVEGFLAPYVIVRRKSDGQRGTLMFRHSPRVYFGWEEHKP